MTERVILADSALKTSLETEEPAKRAKDGKALRYIEDLRKSIGSRLAVAHICRRYHPQTLEQALERSMERLI